MVERVRKLSRDRVQLHIPFLAFGQGCEEPSRIGVFGIPVKLSDRGLFHNSAAIEDRHTVTHLCHQPEVVGDQDHGHLELGLDFPDQFDDLHLDGHIQGAGRFVGNEKIGLTGKGGGYDHPLFQTRRSAGEGSP